MQEQIRASKQCIITYCTVPSPSERVLRYEIVVYINTMLPRSAETNMLPRYLLLSTYSKLDAWRYSTNAIFWFRGIDARVDESGSTAVLMRYGITSSVGEDSGIKLLRSTALRCCVMRDLRPTEQMIDREIGCSRGRNICLVREVLLMFLCALFFTFAVWCGAVRCWAPRHLNAVAMLCRSQAKPSWLEWSALPTSHLWDRR